jgi:hypothetical protein
LHFSCAEITRNAAGLVAPILRPEMWRKSFGETDGHDGVERLHGVLRYLLRCVEEGNRAIWRRSIKIQFRLTAAIGRQARRGG